MTINFGCDLAIFQYLEFIHAGQLLFSKGIFISGVFPSPPSSQSLTADPIRQPGTRETSSRIRAGAGENTINHDEMV